MEPSPLIPHKHAYSSDNQRQQNTQEEQDILLKHRYFEKAPVIPENI